MCKIFGRKNSECEPKKTPLDIRLDKIEREIADLNEKIGKIHYLMECKEYTTLYPNSIYYNCELIEYQEKGYKLKKIFKNGSQLWIKETISRPATDAKEK